MKLQTNKNFLDCIVQELPVAWCPNSFEGHDFGGPVLPVLHFFPHSKCFVSTFILLCVLMFHFLSGHFYASQFKSKSNYISELVLN